ncbi:hypothetical protein EX30DRAFT_68157 [Ascodesmis nigricans]|uniref:Uncharacterized protein n=1 Tax=Ascodesmis nigricans TaxID=341454 RepID=A0A4S2MU87_9PEZI|nr:hypothetical protein EX30DRAFT_68157 [Ascodesmis nigricans]
MQQNDEKKHDNICRIMINKINTNRNTNNDSDGLILLFFFLRLLLHINITAPPMQTENHSKRPRASKVSKKKRKGDQYRAQSWSRLDSGYGITSCRVIDRLMLIWLAIESVSGDAKRKIKINDKEVERGERGESRAHTINESQVKEATPG